ncbi:putative Queuosine salvage protein [Blattamonas nauphoetae]|uniref:Queuosine 5'-phosphate N-glycosylase/hydrolase n=1 Tax=Blattamonas nauphoetae TaxID=2049346 RepID=A0ABQ9YHJ8_9EUKA|nr:putative Queuosine salvage protein [Blattamonas nauphoetae]
MINPVHTSSAFISAHSKHVTVSRDGCLEFVNWYIEENKKQTDKLPKEPISDFIPTPAKFGDERTAEWTFFLDVLNFSFFWDDGSSYIVEYPNGSGTRFLGYWGHIAAMQRALDENIPFLSAKWMSECTVDDLRKFYRESDDHPENVCPLVETRVQVLNEAGKVLLTEFEGSVTKMILSCNRSAVALSMLLSDRFSSFRDIGYYPRPLDNQPSSHSPTKKFGESPIIPTEWNSPVSSADAERVFFHKRAQIFPADLWNTFKNTRLGEFTDIDAISMFADYRVPQVLAHFRCIQYSPFLDALLRGQVDYACGKTKERGIEDISKAPELVSGCLLEEEIRACSIEALRLVVELLNEKVETSSAGIMKKMNQVEMDFYLWGWGKFNINTMTIPAHKTRTTFY